MTLRLPGRDPLGAVYIGLGLIFATYLGGLWQAATGVFTPVDHAVQAAIATMQFPALTQVMVVLTRCGQEEGLTVIAGLLYWAGRRTECGVLLLLLILAGSGANDHMKDWFALARPTAVETRQLDPSSGAGFGYPSGHTVSGVFLAWVAYQLVQRRFWLCVCVAPLMAFTRIYLGVHYFSDTVGGGLHGLGWLYLAGAGAILVQRLHPEQFGDAGVRRAYAGGGAVAAIVFAFMNPAPDLAVRFAPLLLGAGLGAAAVPFAWRPKSAGHYVGMVVVGMLLVLAVRVGLGAVLPRIPVAHSVRYGLMGLVLGGSPLALTWLGLATYVPRSSAPAPLAVEAA